MMTDFVQALKEKYIDQDDVADQIYIPRDSTITTQIKLVGFDRISHIQKQLVLLTSLDLSSQKISEAGQIQTLYNNLPRVRVLNLANNHLVWRELICILKCTPRLQELIITLNELSPQPDLRFLTSRLEPLTSLVIGKTHIKWHELISILSKIWPHVTDLDLWDSQLTCDDMSIKMPSNDEVSFIRQIFALRLSKNNFINPYFLIHMGTLENLGEVDLSRCRMESFRVTDALAQSLSNIITLNISYNELTTWLDISSLIKLKNLKSLICHENPFFIREKMAKALIIGRVKNITILNREEINRVARKDSEIYYLKTILPEYRNFKLGVDIEFLSKHPRFNELGDIYGLPEEPCEKHPQEKYINIDLHYGEKKISRRLPRDMRVSNLRMLAKRLFKLSPSTPIKLTCFSSSKIGDQLNYDLENDSQSLSFYLVENDKKIVIQKI